MMSLVSCKELCLTTRGCEGVVFAADMIHGCYRRAGISADLCQPSATYDLHILLPPSPPPATPPPPAPEPTPPQRPVPRPTPPPPMAVAIDQINERFQSGHPSNTLAEAGVLVHQFDGLEDWDNGRGYRPCHSGWCNGRYDHVSVSLINRQLPLVFNDNGGIVLSTATRFNCSFPHDGGTQSRSISSACGLRTAYPPNRLKECMQNQLVAHSREYNEFVVSAQYWDAHLPRVVEAIMFVRDASQAKKAHAAFVRRYGIRIPLVRYVPGMRFEDGESE